jgi:hypothetical protein
MNNNPLKQYFRRPAVYLRLPSKRNMYPQGVIDYPESEELPVYPMTAIDEITVKTPDALFNGTAVADIIKSCVPNIKNPWEILSVDLDAVLVSIRAASNGDKIEIETTCPSCKEESKYDISLVNLLSRLKLGDYEAELQINDLFIKFKPLTYAELNQASLKQFELQRAFSAIAQLDDVDEKLNRSKEALKIITEMTMDFLTKAIEYIRAPTGTVGEYEFIRDFMANCDKNVYSKIKDHHTTLKDDSSIKPIPVTCINCTHEYEQPFVINYSDFFE